MGQIPFTTDDVSKILEGRYTNPLHDLSGDDYTTASRLTMLADTDYDFVCNGNVRNFKNLPSYVTTLWNTSTNLTTFGELLDTPVMVITVRFKFDPTVAAAGIITVNPYVNETVPVKFKPVSVPYKASLTDVSALVTIYVGSETGFDVKNNVAYEIDERYHNKQSQKIKDEIRENKIKEITGCKFVRIDEAQYMRNKRYKSLEDFSK